MANTQIHHIKTISEYHRAKGLPQPGHPLLSLIDYSTIKHSQQNNNTSFVFDFYSISIKRNLNAKIKYGQQSYDFDNGIMFFISPGQVFKIEVDISTISKATGWILLIHPDFLWGTLLAKTIKQYEYFNYAVNEALFLSAKEEKTIVNILQQIRQEYQSNLDKYTQGVIIAQLDLLLNYSERFYNRQFLTRKIGNYQILNRLEEILTEYFSGNDLVNKGLPTVHFIAESLNVSSNYLSGMLKSFTGQTTQQHIHERLIAKAKEKLSVTNLSVSEIAYELGFLHVQSFSKLFKNKVKVSPLEFRASFN